VEFDTSRNSWHVADNVLSVWMVAAVNLDDLYKEFQRFPARGETRLEIDFE